MREQMRKQAEMIEPLRTIWRGQEETLTTTPVTTHRQLRPSGMGTCNDSRESEKREFHIEKSVGVDRQQGIEKVSTSARKSEFVMCFLPDEVWFSVFLFRRQRRELCNNLIAGRYVSPCRSLPLQPFKQSRTGEVSSLDTF